MVVGLLQEKKENVVVVAAEEEEEAAVCTIEHPTVAAAVVVVRTDHQRSVAANVVAVVTLIKRKNLKVVRCNEVYIFMHSKNKLKMNKNEQKYLYPARVSSFKFFSSPLFNTLCISTIHHDFQHDRPLLQLLDGHSRGAAILRRAKVQGTLLLHYKIV